jgi:phytoene dehydrogenase-like protein
MTKKIIIIGAGLGGLSAGCYARMNGFEAEIYEMHDKPGGLCTSWDRRGYTIDYSIHDLSGPNEDSALHFLWQELGALEGMEMHYHDEFWRVETPDGLQVPMVCDIDEFGALLKSIAPEDKDLIEDYLKDARKFGRVEFMGVVSGKLRNYFQMLGILGAMKRWGEVSMQAFAQRFSNPTLRQAFPYFQYGWPHVPVMIHMAFLGMCHQKLFGFPEGGSLAFAENIAKRFTNLGGQIHYQQQVKTILVKDNRAVGIELEDGSQVWGDYVISNADGYRTIYHMLDGQYTNEEIDAYYKQILDEQEMNTTISLGVDRTFPSHWRAISYLLDEPVDIAGAPRSNIDVEFYGPEYGFSPVGKSVLKILMKSKYSYWKELQEDRGAYRQVKDEAIERVIAILEDKFSGLREQIEMRDMATPVTVERYTNCIQGNQAWSPPDFSLMKMMQGVSKTLPGLDGFYMAGQWALGSLGIPNVAMDGRNVIKKICKGERIRFKTTAV